MCMKYIQRLLIVEQPFRIMWNSCEKLHIQIWHKHKVVLKHLKAFLCYITSSPPAEGEEKKKNHLDKELVLYSAKYRTSCKHP